jgi:hypothetical protein
MTSAVTVRGAITDRIGKGMNPSAAAAGGGRAAAASAAAAAAAAS